MFFKKGIFEIEKENYATTKECLEQILPQLKEIQTNGVEIGKKQHNIIFKLGGDLFFIAHMLGINNANSKHPCPWCKFNAKKTVEIDKEWPISRTHKESLKILAQGKNVTKKKTKATSSKIVREEDSQTLGYKYKPIIDFIQFEDVAIDVLHVLLRISEKIFESLITKINKLDGNIQSANFENRPILKHFFDILSIDCKIWKPYSFINVPGKVKEIKIRSLNGNEILRIFKAFSKDGALLSNFFSDETEDHEFVSKFPNLKLNEWEDENYVWLNFYTLYVKMQNFSSSDKSFNMKLMRKDLKDWLEHYLIISPGSITAYVHSFVYHIPDMMIRHKNINFYNQQGLEKLNDFIRLDYFRSSNKIRSDNKYLKQLLEKRNRIEYFNLNIFKPGTPKYKLNLDAVANTDTDDSMDYE